MNERHPHWTSDPDLVERYVLNRLDKAERSRLAAHLGECDECARVVRAEEVLAAGIRAHGRAVLKTRLKEKVGRKRERGLSWYQLVGAAAAIVVLVTVGLHNRWFVHDRQSEERSTSSIPEQPPEAVRPDAGEIRDRSEEARSTPSSAGRPEESSPVAAVPAPAAEEGPMRIEIDRQQETGAGAVLADKMLKPVEATAPAAMMLSAKESTYWLDGMELAATREKRDLLFQERSAAKREALQVEAEGRLRKDLQISQRPVTDLPASRQAVEYRNGRAVQALLQRADSLTRFILFLDPPATEQELEGADIIQITRDSIVIDLGSRQIGYRVPPGIEIPLRSGRRR